MSDPQRQAPRTRRSILHVALCTFHFSLFLAVLSFPDRILADASAWLDKAWPVRRIVTVEAKLTPNQPGDEIGVVEIPTDTLAKPDGSDIRVASSAGRPLPMKLLSVGPGSVARVAFAAATGKNSYAIYYGNPKAPALPKELDLPLKRGLLLETCTFAGGNVNSYEGTAAALKRSRNAPQGADFVPNVFLGHNLFGPPARTISRYSGLLVIPAAGDYGFATSSDDASFLSIDGKLVVEWGGYHGWVGDARYNKTINLAAGAHDFEYLHVNIGGDGGAVAAWRPPGADRWLPIPASAFLPVYRGAVRERERFGVAQAADMTFQHLGETLVGDEDYVQRYRFTSLPAGFDPKGATFAWTFGDGTSVTGAGLNSVEHVYLLDGPHEAAVAVTQGDKRDSVANQIVVTRDWANIIDEKLDPPGVHARLIERYDFAKMKPAAAARAMELCRRGKLPAGYIAAGHALATACQPVDDRVLTTKMEEYARFLIERSATDGPAAAVNEYVAAAERATSPFAKAAMFVGAGRILLDHGNDAKAEQMFNAALKFKDRGGDKAIKAAWIGLGDTHRRRGDGEKALAAYEAAEKLTSSLSPNQAAVEVGSLARSIEFYVRQGDFITARQHLENWDWQFPTQKLQGYSTLLWVRFYQAQKLHSRAIQEASDLVAAADRSNYAPELLLLAADSWVALNDKAKPRQLLDHVIAVYKDSPLAADAKKKLKELEK